MGMKKRLLISAGSIEKQEQVVPVNSDKYVDVKTSIGAFSVGVLIRNFDGSKEHKNNSYYNVASRDLSPEPKDTETTIDRKQPNLRIIIKFKPNKDIGGSDLFFGNECCIPIKDYVPTTLMSAGLRFFKWFLNPTIESDLYGKTPFIYGLALNSFSKLGLAHTSVDHFIDNEKENLSWVGKSPDLDLPSSRKKYFCNLTNADKFKFLGGSEYYLMFDTNFLKLGDSNYNVSLPAFGSQTFDVNVLRFANEKLNSIIWTIKQSRNGSLEEGDYGLVLNFKLVEEEEGQEGVKFTSSE